MKELPNLTPFRFFLAILVVLFHVPQFCENRGFPFFSEAAIFHKGVEAVYMFFCLSGFLIIKQLFTEKEKTGTIDLKRFYIRRALRILPLYITILSIGLLYYNWVLPAMGFDFKRNYEIGKGILLSLFFLPNVFAILYQPGGIIEVLWSIGIEEQFYLLIAPVFLFTRKKCIIQVLGLFTFFYFVLYFSGFIPELSKFAMLYFYFSFSGLIAILSDKIKMNSMIKWSLLFLIIIYFSTDFLHFKNQVYYHLLSMLLFGFFLLSSSHNPVYTLKNKFFIHLGKISYGIYMYHAVVMQLVGFLYLKMEINLSYYPKFALFTVLVIAVTILVSAISYRYFEMYFIKKKLGFKSL